MKAQEKSLGELLRQAGKITSRQIQVALGEQRKHHEPIGKILVRLGFVEETDILQVMQGMMVLTFQCETEFFGIETYRIREVLKYSAFDIPSQEHGPWEGFLTLRGKKLPVLSFRKVLGLAPPPLAKSNWFIVLEKKGVSFVLWVDKVHEVTRFKIDQIEPLPPYLLGKRGEIYYCLGKIKDRLYSVLNPDKLVDEKFLLLPPTEVDYAFPP